MPLGRIATHRRVEHDGKVRHRPRQRAANVNALDQVPHSTWFTNRMGRRPLPPAEVAAGPGLGAETEREVAAGLVCGRRGDQAVDLVLGVVVDDPGADRAVVEPVSGTALTVQSVKVPIVNAPYKQLQDRREYPTPPGFSPVATVK